MPDKNEATLRLQTNILRQLAAAAPSSLKISTLLIGARDEAFRVDEREIEVECAYLSDPEVGLIRREQGTLGAGVKRYILAPKGRDYLTEQGF